MSRKKGEVKEELIVEEKEEQSQKGSQVRQ